MNATDRRLKQSFDKQRFAVARMVADYKIFTPAAFAAQERLAANLERHARLRDFPLADISLTRKMRQTIGVLLIRIGTRLGDPLSEQGAINAGG